MPLRDHADPLDVQPEETTSLLDGRSVDKKYDVIPMSFSKSDSSNEVEQQLNNYVSGFTFDTKLDNDRSSNLVLQSHDLFNTNAMKKSDGGELFNNMTDTVDLKRIHLNTNEFF